MRGPLALSRLMHLYALDRPDLKDAPFVPAVPKTLAATTAEEDIFALIRRQNILLHHPFDSFQPVVEFLQKAASDPDVLAIKMCLYRVGRNSPMVEALLEAIEEDKQVAVLVELKARFDEESNIEWARALESEGVHVVYGLVGLKIHCKVRWWCGAKPDAIRRYVHLATGNYNAVTAHLYTDIGMFTCDEDIGARRHRPVQLPDRLLRQDGLQEAAGGAGESARALRGHDRARDRACRPRASKAHLIFKMNALVDPQMIRLLYQASQAGVKVDLLVRGICCLRPGIAGRQRQHPGDQHRGPVPGAQPHLLLPQRRAGGDLSRQRGPDAAQYRSSRGGAVSGGGSGLSQARTR